MRWVTLAYWRSKGEWTLGGWVCAAHPRGEGAEKKKKISRGDYCQGQDRYQGREEIKRRSFQKKRNLGRHVAGNYSSLFSSPSAFLHFSLGYILSLWVPPYQNSSTLPHLQVGTTADLPADLITPFVLPHFTSIHLLFSSLVILSPELQQSVIIGIEHTSMSAAHNSESNWEIQFFAAARYACCLSPLRWSRQERLSFLGRAKLKRRRPF